MSLGRNGYNIITPSTLLRAMANQGFNALQSDINVAEVEGLITPNQANFLRKKYLELDCYDWFYKYGTKKQNF